MDAERNNHVALMRRIDWRRVAPWLLGLAILSAVVLGPTWPFSYGAGLLNSALIWVLSSMLALAAWGVLLVVACVQIVRRLWVGRKMAAGLWFSAAFGVVLVFTTFFAGRTPSPHLLFARGVITHIEIQTDIDAIQTWVASLQPSDCLDVPHYGRGRHLTRENQPTVLKCQTGIVHLELDAEGRPSVRLTWFGGKAGTWGLVMGHKDMKTPPSGPGMYDEQRFELRPGIYFWYVEG